MKIAFIYDSAYPWFNGGIERRRMLIAEKFIENGDEVHYFTMFRKGMPGYEFRHAGIYFHCAGNAADESKMYVNGRRNIAWALKFAAMVLFKLNKYRFDIVDADAMPYLHLLPIAIYSRLEKAKFIISWAEVWNRDYWISYAGGVAGRIGFFIEKMCSGMSKYHIMNSSKTREEFIRLFGGSGRRIAVFPCAISNGEIAMANLTGAAGARVKSSSLFVAIGRLIPEKRFDYAIEGIRGTGARLEIIGDGPEKERLTGLAAKLGLSKKVVFKRRLNRKQMISTIKSSAGMFMMSEREGLSLATLETIALRVPVIITETTSLPHEVRALCIQVKRKSLHALVKRIIKDNSMFAKELNRKSKAVIENFSDKNTIMVYRNLTRSREYR
ncbi:MAG: glycosyltransferase [Candidatus Marsarchaeota archaeon]|nr:glycosyltransferase [Candidatus Marsarchaeota archaeon]MCL5106006.1 glycosyltransferase [Candidatus Marsarchaeota archaeon]